MLKLTHIMQSDDQVRHWYVDPQKVASVSANMYLDGCSLHGHDGGVIATVKESAEEVARLVDEAMFRPQLEECVKKLNAQLSRKEELVYRHA